MKIDLISVRNFRMLKELDVDLQNKLTLIIGKNNSGKTSFLSLLEKFLSGSKVEFTFDDFNIDTQVQIIELQNSSFTPDNFAEISLSLKLYISYTKDDNIGVASELMMDLDAEKNVLILLYEYALDFEKYQKLVIDYSEYHRKIERDFSYFVSKNVNKYFKVRISAVEFGNELNKKLVSEEVTKSIISLQTISARRNVANEQGRSNTLSSLAFKYYSANVTNDVDFPELHNQLKKTDTDLNQLYEKLFTDIVKEIKELSYNPLEAEISIISSLTEKKIFQDNATVMYKHDDTLLPEDYNGLGYLNLFEIIFSIRIKLDQLSRKNNENEKPTPINLLFIEEPEAHTHPQMQYVFITNIKSLLERHGFAPESNSSLQTILSTHSSHIVSQCDFDDIKYFYRETNKSIKSRSLKMLYSKMVTSKDKKEKEEQVVRYRFVKQYVTLSRAELFFADKAVLIEGDTERILFSSMMIKFDKLNLENKEYVPLLSQNISVIEVGAYAQVFSIFLGFIGIKTLIVTDLDCAKKVNNHYTKCRYFESTTTTNSSIKYFLSIEDPRILSQLADAKKTFSFVDPDWISDQDGLLRIVFQKEENDYQARSFEDAFISKNHNFIINNKDFFTSLQNRNQINISNKDFYEIAENCVVGKTSFAFDILLYSNEKNDNWDIPLYIKEGLAWLVT